MISGKVRFLFPVWMPAKACMVLFEWYRGRHFLLVPNISLPAHFSARRVKNMEYNCKLLQLSIIQKCTIALSLANPSCTALSLRGLVEYVSAAGQDVFTGLS